MRCDIFCNVIDNYGDIGVCWRLARQLANEHELSVRLWVDDLASFAKLCPQADATLESQWQCGVEVCWWKSMRSDSIDFHHLAIANQSSLTPLILDIVIEAFGCKLPESYVAAMVAQKIPPVWINLEYLSAESWVQGCHKLPSPHPRLPLTKYFFFPGFTAQTGGLLLEQDLLARRDALQNDVLAQQQFWQSIGLDLPDADTLKVSLFAYENDALPALFGAWADGTQAVLCLVPEGRIVPQVEQYFADVENYSRGNLQMRILPFVAQEDYDTLLWACDVNFVRGEDSCVRAQWAGKPFVWQIYEQDDGVHREKLQAFLDLYSASLSDATSLATQGLWRTWNGQGDTLCWGDFAAALGELRPHAQTWARHLAANNLTLNLLDFCAEIGTIHAFKIEGQ